MNSWNNFILISILFKSRLIACSTWCLFYLEDTRNQISIKCPTTCCNLNATSTDDVCCESQEFYSTSISLGLWLIIVPVFLFFCCFIMIFSIIACITKLNTLQFYQRHRRNNSNPSSYSTNNNINLDPCVYSINHNLESINQRPPSYNYNYGYSESSQPPTYEDLMNSTQADSKSNELSKV